MKSQENNNRDFSIVFEEVEKYNLKDSSIKDNIVSDDLLEQDETIRAFIEICKEINTSENNSTIFMTFS
ncbi:MAG TPA: hypothetical protein PLB61_00890 [Bacteroidales bacterium]|nr:hypothetical protein [Bacteroidales bacterium]HOH21872.1 hypothetical protein [Bacteroidales bacterium]HPB57176.1 hypothetical protein [Bacteroidales bacterium]HPZ02768.1 hypothetical protein [Bacteroidales bacterium]